jgi:hypothetical protein
MAGRNGLNANTFSVSDEFIQWAEGLSGLVAQIDVEYGGVAEMVENPKWDSSRSKYAAALLEGLRKDVARVAKELKSHVNGYQKVI